MEASSARARGLLAALWTLGAAACAGAGLLAPPAFERFDLERSAVRLDAFPADPEVVLLDRGELRLVWDAEAQVPLARLRRLRRSQALKARAGARFEIEVEPGSKVLGLRARIHSPDGRVRQVDTVHPGVGPRGLPARRVPLGDLPAGAVYEVVWDTWYTDLATLPAWAFDGPRPVLRSEYRVVVPPRFRIDARFRENGQFVRRPPDRFETDAGVRYAWSLADRAPIRPERSAPGPALRGAHVHVLVTDTGSSFPVVASWQDAARWIGARAGTSSVTRALVAEARRVAGEGSPEERARALHAVIAKDLRTDGDPPLWLSALPHPEVVLGAKRANPSAKGWVLVSLLQAAGIEAQPFLYARRGEDALEPDFPWLRSVQGIGALVPRPDGPPLLLDPTSLAAGVDLPPPRLQGTRVVVLAPDGASTLRVPTAAPEVSATRITLRLTPEERGHLDGELVARLEGAAAAEARSALLAAPRDGFVDVAAAILADHGAPLPPTGIVVVGLDDPTTPLELEGTIRAEGVLEREPDGRTLSIPVEAMVRASVPELDRDRSSPRRFGSPRLDEVRVQLALPEGWTVATAPSPVDRLLPPEARVRLGTERTADGVVVMLVRRRAGLSVPSSERGAFLEGQDGLRADEQRLLRLTPPVAF